MHTYVIAAITNTRIHMYVCMYVRRNANTELQLQLHSDHFTKYTVADTIEEICICVLCCCTAALMLAQRQPAHISNRFHYEFVIRKRR